MRVRVGDEWFECAPGRPIMVELSDNDKENIRNMPSEARMYAVFDDIDGLTVDEMRAWMNVGRDD